MFVKKKLFEDLIKLLGLKITDNKIETKKTINELMDETYYSFWRSGGISEGRNSCCEKNIELIKDEQDELDKKIDLILKHLNLKYQETCSENLPKLRKIKKEKK